MARINAREREREREGGTESRGSRSMAIFFRRASFAININNGTRGRVVI